MSTCLSIYTCWLPRLISIQRTCLRSAYSTVSNSDKSSSTPRSTSRFSVKIARFMFEKDCLQSSASMSTHPHYTKAETPADIHEIARDFVRSLEPGLQNRQKIDLKSFDLS